MIGSLTLHNLAKKTACSQFRLQNPPERLVLPLVDSIFETASGERGKRVRGRLYPCCKGYNHAGQGGALFRYGLLSTPPIASIPPLPPILSRIPPLFHLFPQPMIQFPPIRLILIALLAVCLVSCGSESDQAWGEETAEAGADPLATKAEVPIEDCPDELDVICEDGLAFIPLGGFVAEVQVEDLAATQIQDSLESGNGFEWISRTLHFDQGRVVVEGEFIDDRYSNDTLLSESRINRVRVESPMFRTSRGIRVGSPVSALLEVYPEGEFQVDPIPSYQAFQVRLPSSHIYYLVGDTEGEVSEKSLAKYTLATLPPDAPIIAIVVM